MPQHATPKHLMLHNAHIRTTGAFALYVVERIEFTPRKLTRQQTRDLRAAKQLLLRCKKAIVSDMRYVGTLTAFAQVLAHGAR